jgi:hypothetical protein
VFPDGVDPLTRQEILQGWRFEIGGDTTGWLSGVGPFGWGSDQVETSLDIYENTQDRPRTAYFRHEFEVDDPDAFVTFDVSSIADDGAYFYVNGVEVARQNMGDREDTHLTFAVSARRVWVAEADPVLVAVPASLLVEGTNVVAASTHLNFRNTADLTFKLEAVSSTE